MVASGDDFYLRCVMYDVWVSFVERSYKHPYIISLISKNSCGLVGFLADISWEVQCTRTTTTTCILDAKKLPLSPTSSDTGDLRKSEVYEELYGKEATPCCCVASVKLKRHLPKG